jgi:hypothetical protein
VSREAIEASEAALQQLLQPNFCIVGLPTLEIE